MSLIIAITREQIERSDFLTRLRLFLPPLELLLSLPFLFLHQPDVLVLRPDIGQSFLPVFLLLPELVLLALSEDFLQMLAFFLLPLADEFLFHSEFLFYALHEQVVDFLFALAFLLFPAQLVLQLPVSALLFVHYLALPFLFFFPFALIVDFQHFLLHFVVFRLLFLVHLLDLMLFVQLLVQLVLYFLLLLVLSLLFQFLLFLIQFLIKPKNRRPFVVFVRQLINRFRHFRTRNRLRFRPLLRILLILLLILLRQRPAMLGQLFHIAHTRLLTRLRTRLRSSFRRLLRLLLLLIASLRLYFRFQRL